MELVASTLKGGEEGLGVGGTVCVCVVVEVLGIFLVFQSVVGVDPILHDIFSFSFE